MIYIINFENIFFKGFTRGGPWVPSLMKQNFNRTKFMKSFTAWGRNIRYGWSNEDAKRIYVCTYILSPNYFFNYIKCQNKIHIYIYKMIYTIILCKWVLTRSKKTMCRIPAKRKERYIGHIGHIGVNVYLILGIWYLVY